MTFQEKNYEDSKKMRARGAGAGAQAGGQQRHNLKCTLVFGEVLKVVANHLRSPAFHDSTT